jgi:hypothetical protein
MFNQSRVPFQTILEVLVMWLHKYTTDTIVKEADICKETVGSLIGSFRDLLAVWLEESSDKQIGGPGAASLRIP